MSVKDLVIKKILEFGKKHKIFVYPTLAIVAMISAISYLFYWSKGNGKRVVATILVIVLFISQSYLFTSSASNDLIDDNQLYEGNVIEEGEELIEEEEQPNFVKAAPRVDVNIRYSWGQETPSFIAIDAEVGEYITIGENVTLPNNTEYITYDGWYTNEDGTGDCYANGSKMLVPEEGINLTLYAKRTVSKYKINLNNWCVNNGTSASNIYIDHIKSSEESTIVSIDANNVSRKGYNLVSITTPNGGTMLPDSSGYIKYTLNNNTYNYEYTFTLNWEPVKYSILYTLSDADKSSGLCSNGIMSFSSQLVYDTPNNIEDNNNRFKKRGYNVIGWSTDSSATTMQYSFNQVINDDLYSDSVNGIRLYPVWEYVGFTLEGDNATFQYGKPDDSFAYFATYDGGESYGSDFNYSVSTTDINKAREYGLTIQVDNTNHKVTISGTPTKITDTNGDGEAEYITFSILVTDANDGTKSHSYEKLYMVGKRAITVTGVSNNYKMYDGNRDVAVGTIIFTGAASGDGLEVKCSGQKGTFDNPNVGDNKDILLTGLTFNVTGNTPESVLNNYFLQSDKVNVKGNVEPRTVYIETSASYTATNPNNIYSGENEAFANFKIAEVPSGKLSENIIDSEKTTDQTALKKLLGISGFVVSSEAWISPGTYGIDVSTGNISNYEVVVKNKGNLSVLQEAPILNTNYTISGDIGENGWYKRVTVSPKEARSGYYNQIKLNNGEYANSVSITEDTYTSSNNVLNIQLKNRITGAYTSIGALEDIKVDSTPPVISNTTITQGTGNVLDGVVGTRISGIGSFLEHGNYFRNTIDVNITFEEDTSGNSMLYYDIFGTGAYSSIAIVDNKASFSVIEGNCQNIAFYVSDVAGNTLGTPSNPCYLVKNGVNTWIVEANGPSVDIYVKNPAGSIITSEDSKYYSRGDITAKVIDNGSGIYGVRWVVDGVADANITEVSNTETRESEVEFTKAIASNGTHLVQVIAYDNAENYTESEIIEFNVDNNPPAIEITSGGDDTWVSERTVEFKVTDNLSGIKYIDVKDANRNSIAYIRTDSNKVEANCSVTFTTKGTYYLCAEDEAGNEIELEVIYNNISSATPELPIIEVNPIEGNGNNNWYNEIPEVNIHPAQDVDNGTTNVITYYKLWKGDTEPINETAITSIESIKLDEEGIYHIMAYSKSESGLKCDGEVRVDICVDSVKPTVKLGKAVKEDGNIIVNFTVKDNLSGVDPDSVMVQYNGKNIAVTMTQVKGNPNNYTGSFVVEYKGTYSISVADMAGNIADETKFEPMSMKIKTVTNISETTANIGATIYKGTYGIKAYQVQYKKEKDKNYVNVTPNVIVEDSGNIVLSHAFNGLDPNTVYNYRVIAISEAGENLTYTGKFMTLDGSKIGSTIIGKVKYNDNVSEEDKKQSIFVSLYDGNTCIRSVEKNNGEAFEFYNIPDGSYNIVATNGLYTNTIQLIIENGSIISPTNSILMVLGGKNTSVEIVTDDTPSISVKGLDDIFEYDSANYTSEDISLIEDGGAVEFRLYASLMNVTTVSSEDVSVIYNLIGDGSVVGAYIDITLYKIKFDAVGNIISKEKIEEIGGTSLKVTVPLGNLSGKNNLRVIRTHNGGCTVLPDIDANTTTYTFESGKFSTYAMVYDVTRNNTDDSTDTSTEDNINKPDVPDDTNNQNNSNPQSTITDDATDTVSKTPSITTLKGSSSPKTGDINAVEIIGVIAILAGISGIYFRRKIR